MLQINMPMPESCVKCPFVKHIAFVWLSKLCICAADTKERRIDEYVSELDAVSQVTGIVEKPKKPKPDWCPLKEVKIESTVG